LEVRVGYPRNFQGEWLLKRNEVEDPAENGLVIVEPTQVTYFMYVAYLGIPFLFEMRAILDWWNIDTCLDLLEWLKLADIHSTLFKVAYLRAQEARDKRYVGELMGTLMVQHT